MAGLEKRSIRVLLNGVEQDITPPSADTTLLQWLRQDQRLTGSKEGCAEGDCGACSVVIGKKNSDGTISHAAANACIFLLPMIDGLSITTVEHIAGPNGELHPVQEAMVHHHGSQCGFCTPGFVVSLFAGWRSGCSWTRLDIEDLLAGNLCRCTGYGPIVAAAMSLAKAQPPQWEQDRIKAEREWLEAHSNSSLNLSGDQTFVAPTTITELSKAIADYPDAQIIAGATDIGLWITKQFRNIPRFISVMRVPELSVISKTEDGFVIPAGVSHADAKQHLAKDFPPLEELWRRFASTQVRATGTVCGNIANGSPIGDLAPAFLALGATLVLQHRQNQRHLPIEDFFLDYQQQDRREGEWLREIHLPTLKTGEIFNAIKISRRFDQDISAVMGGYWFALDDGVITAARLGYGGMAAIPKRAKNTETALLGHRLTDPLPKDVLAALAEDFNPIDDMRASRSYRQDMARNLLIKALDAAAHGKTHADMLAGSSPLLEQHHGAAE